LICSAHKHNIKVNYTPQAQPILDQVITSIKSLLNEAEIIFWDFDGVIKDSLDVKSSAFERLFLPFGRDIAAQVRKHHEQNGGMSRFEKIPIYLGWAGELVGKNQVEEYCRHFSALVRDEVINSPWVPGVRKYLIEQHDKCYFVLVTATPQLEIEDILSSLNIDFCFREVYGAPQKKNEVIMEVLLKERCPSKRALIIGDTETDMQAAKANLVPFILRSTPLNLDIQAEFTLSNFKDL
jgi:phosphoglycolate phosphatase-like HAD superfamily hydrolase